MSRRGGYLRLFNTHPRSANNDIMIEMYNNCIHQVYPHCTIVIVCVLRLGKKAIDIIILDIFNFLFAYRRRFRLPYIRTLCRDDTHKMYNRYPSRYPGLGGRKLTRPVSLSAVGLWICAHFALG